MAAKWKDEDTGITHIRVYSAMTLCGILEGWTRQGDEPAKEKYGVTCGECQQEVVDIKTLRAASVGAKRRHK